MKKLFGTVDEIAPSTLIRNHDTVHGRECWRVKGRKVNPWLWAEGKTRGEVAPAYRNGIRFCRTCDPLSLLLESTEGESDHG